MDNGGLRWGHNRGDPGVSTGFAFEPKRGVAGAVFASGPGHSTMNDLIDSLLTDPA